MNAFDVAAILIAVAAVCGYVNHRVLRLPATTGTLLVALVSSVGVLAFDTVVPGLSLREALDRFLSQIDFNEALMHGMLSFLLFAGALHVDLTVLLAHKWSIGLLSTFGVIISTALTGWLSHAVFGLVGLPLPLTVCFMFGALISPTDPIAVLALLKQVRAPKDLEVQIAGESLFNDGIGVVLFVALGSIAGLSGAAGEHLSMQPGDLALFFLREVGGGAALGLGFGYTAYRALKTLNEHTLELLITVALVMFTYSLSFRLGVSGPIAMVVSGLLIGNPGRRKAMSAQTQAYIGAFWNMMDEILNAVLFLLLGLEVLSVPAGLNGVSAGILLIPVVLAARLASVAFPIFALRLPRPSARGLIPVLTWGGLRGGLPVAMVLSLPSFPAKGLLLVSTYAIVVFSIVVQGLTMKRLLARYGFRTR